MICEIHDYPTRVLVTSESEGDKASYLVDLCAYRLPQDGICNGRCQCAHFIYKCEPELKRNPGRIRRCKHISIARDYALDYLIIELCKRDPNILEEHQT